MATMLNLVYDYWDEENPIPNGKTQYPNRFFWDVDDFVLHYVNSFSNVRNEIVIRNCKIKDVYENPNQKYYYFICHATMNIDEIIHGNLIISQEIKECMRICNNFNIVFFSHHESDNEEGFKILNNSDLPKKQIQLINNNYKLYDYVNKYDSEIKVFSTMYLPIIVSITLQEGEGTQFSLEKKDKFFMCFNRSPKIHRYSLLASMIKKDLLRDSNWSLIPTFPVNYTHEDYSKIFETEELESYDSEFRIIGKSKLKISDFEKSELSFNEKNEITILNPKFKHLLTPPDIPLNYINSYVNIVTETKFLDEDNVVQISEKSFKPFFYYQFPMILATHHHIKSLKEKYDFDFFDDVIDHSYDNEPNQKKRFNMFVNELVRLHKNKEKIIGFYENIQERFEENKKKVIEIGKNNSDFIFIKSLTN
jgi:hypothetical protein